MQNRFQRRGKQCQNAGKARKNGIFDRFTGNSEAKSSIPDDEAGGIRPARHGPAGRAADRADGPKIGGSSRKVRETNRKEPDEREEEMVIAVPISEAFGNLDFVVEPFEFTC